MQLEHSFTVPVGVEQAWEVLLDIERVAPCMPGAVLDSVEGDNFTGRVKIKLGPVNLTYKGSASFVEKDADARRVVLDAKGKDARGNGTAAATVTATLVGVGDSTEVKVLTDLNITGKPAQFGRGVMVDVGNKLIGQFASCLEDKISGGSEVEAAAKSEAAASPHEEVPAEDSAAAQPAPSESASPPAVAAAPARSPAREPEPIDLLELAGGSVMTRVAPAAGGVALLLLIFFFLRRRH
ncbi:MAG: SRPBCC family protein [Geodermatophilaceae bacterium]|nr:SRPBCC family protein [Geodermatophilaceae bacterium]